MLSFELPVLWSLSSTHTPRRTTIIECLKFMTEFASKFKDLELDTETPPEHTHTLLEPHSWPMAP